MGDAGLGKPKLGCNIDGTHIIPFLLEAAVSSQDAFLQIREFSRGLPNKKGSGVHLRFLQLVEKP